MSSQLFDFVDRLKPVQTAEEAAQCFLKFGLELGACSVNTFFGSDLGDQFVTTYPDWWAEHTTGLDDFNSIHMIREVRKGELPRVEAGIEICPKNPTATPAGLVRVNEMFDHFGVRSACTMPMPDQDGVYRGAGVGLGFEDDERRFRMRMDESGGFLGVAAFTAFTKMSLLRDKPKERDPLSPRQREILLRLAVGKQISRIAEDLGITESAVNLYLYNLKKKLKVKTREQALAQAIVNGWITP